MRTRLRSEALGGGSGPYRKVRRDRLPCSSSKACEGMCGARCFKCRLQRVGKGRPYTRETARLDLPVWPRPVTGFVVVNTHIHTHTFLQGVSAIGRTHTYTRTHPHHYIIIEHISTFFASGGIGTKSVYHQPSRSGGRKRPKHKDFGGSPGFFPGGLPPPRPHKKIK